MRNTSTRVGSVVLVHVGTACDTICKRMSLKSPIGLANNVRTRRVKVTGNLVSGGKLASAPRKSLPLDLLVCAVANDREVVLRAQTISAQIWCCHSICRSVAIGCSICRLITCDIRSCNTVVGRIEKLENTNVIDAPISVFVSSVSLKSEYAYLRVLER